MGAEGEQEKKTVEESRPDTPITADQFISWKRQKDADASAWQAETARKRAEDISSGVVQMNGRELFFHEPWVFDNSQY